MCDLRSCLAFAVRRGAILFLGSHLSLLGRFDLLLGELVKGVGPVFGRMVLDHDSATRPFVGGVERAKYCVEWSRRPVELGCDSDV